MTTIKYGGLVKQNNSALNPEGSSACNFRAIQAAAEVHVGKKLTPEQINAATAALYKSGAMRNDPKDGSHYVVVNQDAVLNDALERLGSSDTGSIGEGVKKSEIPNNADATIVRGRTPNNNPHSQLGDSKGNPVWDPYHKDPVPLTGTEYRPIFFYKKEE